MVKNLQKQFSALLGATPVVEKKAPSSFQFTWTEGDTDSPCFHGHSLQGLLIMKDQSLITKNSLYWLSTQKFCKRYACFQNSRSMRHDETSCSAWGVSLSFLLWSYNHTISYLPFFLPDFPKTPPRYLSDALSCPFFHCYIHVCIYMCIPKYISTPCSVFIVLHACIVCRADHLLLHNQWCALLWGRLFFLLSACLMPVVLCAMSRPHGLLSSPSILACLLSCSAQV